MKRPGPATGIFLVMILVIAFIATQCHMQPAHGQTITPAATPILVATASPALRPVAFMPLISPRYRAEPVQSSCVAPGPCEIQETK